MTIETLDVHKAVDGIPNSRLPLVIYRNVVPAFTADAAGWMEQHFAASGWPAQSITGTHGGITQLWHNPQQA